MDRDEVGHRRAVHHRVEQRPVGHCVGAVAQVLGHDVRMRHRTGVEVIARERDRPGKHAFAHERIDRERESRALAVAEPGDTRRQSLEGHAFACAPDPVRHDPVLGEVFEQVVVDDADVVGVVRQGDPAKRADRAAKQRAQERLGEHRDLERAGHAAVLRMCADQIAVVEHDRATILEAEHRLDVAHDRRAACLHQLRPVGVAHRARFLERVARRHVAVDKIVRGGLVGDDIGHDAAREDRREHVGRVAEQADRDRLAARLRVADQRERLVEIARLPLEEAHLQPLVDARLIDLDDERRRIGHAPRERLRAAHSAEAGRQDEAPAQIVAEVALGDAREDFIGALDHALRADVLPVARREAAPADQVAAFQFVEMLCLRPLADQVAVRHHDERCARMRAQQRDRLAGLDDERLVLVHCAQRAHDRVVRRPVARGAAERRVDDQLIGILADREDVFQKTQQRLLAPAFAAQRIAGRDFEGAVHRAVPLRSAGERIVGDRDAERGFDRRVDRGIEHRRRQRNVCLRHPQHVNLHPFL
ncbi:hypothetical protein BURPS1710b_2184 [Burkholderia pseudomallei 1710b]|uniref:Uncharacterized protein n=1 Tax=Burkholderia pseudomallei (strain 1710b) TaxID=320372 RepID=Q3JS74_BURP1|nr:hypothetical protein BURPS1710b_2184 [Burkholderia pseudomallei 1710b]